MESTAKKNYTLPIIMMVALFFMISFVTGLQNPFGIIVKNQFAASNFMSQLGNAANFIAYAFMGIPAGMLLQKIGYKKTALLAIIVGFCGVGISYLSGVAGLFDRCFRVRFLYVYVEYRSKPDVEHARWWWKQR